MGATWRSEIDSLVGLINRRYSCRVVDSLYVNSNPMRYVVFCDGKYIYNVQDIGGKLTVGVGMK